MIPASSGLLVPAFFIHLQFLLWESTLLFNKKYLYKTMESCKRCSIPFEKTQSCSKRCGMPLSGQYSCAICSLSSVYSHLFNMQNSCQKVQYPMHQSNIPWTFLEDDCVAYTWQFPIRQHSILFKKQCYCKNWRYLPDKWSTPVEKVQSSLFFLRTSSFVFRRTVSFILYERFVLSWCTAVLTFLT